jgi:glutamyl-tRNA synthetase
VLHYLRGLANARLADRPIDEVATEPICLTECSVAGPLVDLDKLTDISSNFIADLPGTTVLDEVASWAQRNDPDLLPVLQESRDLALRALDVERGDVENKRKDLAKWSDFRPVYGFFFPQVFELVTDPGDERFGTVPPPVVVDLASDFVDGYRSDMHQPHWFQQIRDLADSQGFAPNAKAYKADPERYVGMLRDAASVIRVLLTGSTRSPDLHAVASVLGEDEVKRRVGAVREQA